MTSHSQNSKLCCPRWGAALPACVSLLILPFCAPRDALCNNHLPITLALVNFALSNVAQSKLHCIFSVMTLGLSIYVYHNVGFQRPAPHALSAKHVAIALSTGTRSAYSTLAFLFSALPFMVIIISGDCYSAGDPIFIFTPPSRLGNPLATVYKVLVIVHQ